MTTVRRSVAAALLLITAGLTPPLAVGWAADRVTAQQQERIRDGAGGGRSGIGGKTPTPQPGRTPAQQQPRQATQPATPPTQAPPPPGGTTPPAGGSTSSAPAAPPTGGATSAPVQPTTQPPSTKPTTQPPTSGPTTAPPTPTKTTGPTQGPSRHQDTSPADDEEDEGGPTSSDVPQGRQPSTSG